MRSLPSLDGDALISSYIYAGSRRPISGVRLKKSRERLEVGLPAFLASAKCLRGRGAKPCGALETSESK